MSCNCSTKPTLVFACSGAADVGEVADRAARACAKEGLGRMFCLAGIGAGLESFIAGAKNARYVVAINGCRESCASRSLERAGVTPSVVVELGALGFAKGASRPDEVAVGRVVEVLRRELDALKSGGQS
jgi:uncharacterized metal-binding protein